MAGKWERFHFREARWDSTAGKVRGSPEKGGAMGWGYAGPGAAPEGAGTAQEGQEGGGGESGGEWGQKKMLGAVPSKMFRVVQVQVKGWGVAGAVAGEGGGGVFMVCFTPLK